MLSKKLQMIYDSFPFNKKFFLDAYEEGTDDLNEILYSSIEPDVETPLKKDYELAKECFSTCSVEFFLFCEDHLGEEGGTEEDIFSNVINKHRKLELLNILEEHIRSLNDPRANLNLERMKEREVDFKRLN